MNEKPLQGADHRRVELRAQALVAFAQVQAECRRLQVRLDGIERDLAAHLRPGSDPCAQHGEEWPCHVACAVEPDTSVLRVSAGLE